MCFSVLEEACIWSVVDFGSTCDCTVFSIQCPKSEPQFRTLLMCDAAERNDYTKNL